MAIKREKVISTAEKLVTKGKIEAAIKEYRKVLAENPNDANTLNRVGDLFARLERFDEAVKLFSQIAEQYTVDGFFVKAIAIYKKIIKLSPQSLQVYERLAELYFKQGLLNEARAQYQILADHYESKENAASAITIYQRMTEIDPESPAYLLKLAQMLQREQLHEKAIRAYRQLANLFLVNGSVDEATQVYLSVLESYHQDLDFLREVVQSLYAEGHGDAARKVLARAQELNAGAAAIGAALFAAAEEPPVSPYEAPPEPAFSVPGLSAPAAEPEEVISFTPIGPPPAKDDETETFTLNLDDDEPPPTQVFPPEDMREESGGAFGFGAVAQPAAPPRAGARERLVEEAADELEIDWTSDEVSEADLLPQDAEIEVPIELEGELEIEIEGMEALDEEADGAEARPAKARHEDDLLAEAQVFAKYGLRPKAEDRILELLAIRPDHVQALGLLARLELEAGRHDEAVRHANEVGTLAATAGELSPWYELRDVFAQAGLELEEQTAVAVAPAPAERPHPDKPQERFAQLFEDLDETGGSPAEAVAAPPAAPTVFDEVDELFSADLAVFDEAPVEAAFLASPAPVSEIEALMESAGRQDEGGLVGDDFVDLLEAEPAAAAPAAQPAASGLVSLADELDLGELAGGAGETAGAVPAEDDTGMSWLDDVATETGKATGEDALFADEDDFFDLAAELEAEMSGSDEEEHIALEQPQEQSLEDIIDGFKRGVAENLSTEDYDTHFNLGIAYREMGLLDEAIGSFQTASKDIRHLVECSSMLGMCFLEKGLPELAVKWYRKGLESPAISEDQALALLYDMATAYLHLADYDAAYRTFVEVYGMNSNYHDVAERVQELAQYMAAIAGEAEADASA